MFTKVLAMELAEHQITVNSVAPGVIEIPERAAPRMNNAFGTAVMEAIPWGRQFLCRRPTAQWWVAFFRDCADRR